MRILIVDDEEMIRELIHVTLSQDPRFEVFQASSGEKAVEAARALEPGLILMDVRMASMGLRRASRSAPSTVRSDRRSS